MKEEILIKSPLLFSFWGKKRNIIGLQFICSNRLFFLAKIPSKSIELVVESAVYLYV